MVEALVVAKPKPPEHVPEDELYQILRSSVREPGKRALGTRISPEGHRIIDRAARRYGVDSTKALEIILREWREIIGSAKKDSP